jgi:hypothetical protein
MEVAMFSDAVDFGSFYCEEDLYDRYLELIDDGRRAIESQTAPGSLREELLKDYMPLPREHFEARLESLSAMPVRYQAAVAALRGGY